MRRLRKPPGCVKGRRLPAASLLEAVVASVLFLTVFAAATELLPRLAVHGDDALLQAEADYRMDRAFDKYGSGLWPCGAYGESYAWGGLKVRVEPYKDYKDLQLVTVSVQMAGSRSRITMKQTVAWVQE